MSKNSDKKNASRQARFAKMDREAAKRAKKAAKKAAKQEAKNDT